MRRLQRDFFSDVFERVEDVLNTRHERVPLGDADRRSFPTVFPQETAEREFRTLLGAIGERIGHAALVCDSSLFANRYGNGTASVSWHRNEEYRGHYVPKKGRAYGQEITVQMTYRVSVEIRVAVSVTCLDGNGLLEQQ